VFVITPAILMSVYSIRLLLKRTNAVSDNSSDFTHRCQHKNSASYTARTVLTLLPTQMSMLIVKVDLDCHKCYDKMRKILCKLQGKRKFCF
jgi:hypothetical protein